jgi:hypothetical protein
MQAHFVKQRSVQKDGARLADEDTDLAGVQTSNAGYPDISGHGLFLAASATVTVELAPIPTGEPRP